MLFSAMVTLNFMFISLAGISFFATAITEEKEEDTLGLLKMAGVSTVAAAGQIDRPAAGCRAAAAGPGAVHAAGDHARGRDAAAGGRRLTQATAYMLLLANLGLCCSVVCKRSQQACALMTFLLIGFFALFPLLQMILRGVYADVTQPAARFVLDAAIAVCDWLVEASVWNRITATKSAGFAESVFGVQFPQQSVPLHRVLFLLTAPSSTASPATWRVHRTPERARAQAYQPLRLLWPATARGARDHLEGLFISSPAARAS